MTDAPIIKKVPGQLAKFNHEKDGFVDLKSKSKTELLDLLEREKKLLNNKKFLEKLPDKGAKIYKFQDRVLEELNKREENEKLCNLLSNLHVDDSKEALNKLEWTGNAELSNPSEVTAGLEEEIDPLRILATHSGTAASKLKQIRKTESDILIQPSDVAKGTSPNLNIDVYAEQLCHRFDKNAQKEERKKFYPNKSLNNAFSRSVAKDKEPAISAAYVPRKIASDTTKTKLLSLEDSIKIYEEQSKQLKEIEMRHAMEKLMHKSDVTLGIPQNITTGYREYHSGDSDDDSYINNEALEEDDEDEKDTAVFYNLIDGEVND